MTTTAPHPTYIVAIIPRDLWEGTPGFLRWTYQDREDLLTQKAYAEEQRAISPDFNRRQSLSWALNFGIDKALATIDQRAGLTWDSMFEVFKLTHGEYINRWLKSRVYDEQGARQIVPHYILWRSQKDHRELATDKPTGRVWLSNIDNRDLFGRYAPEEFTVFPDGRSFHENQVGEEVCKAIAQATGDYALKPDARFGGNDVGDWYVATREPDENGQMREVMRVFGIVGNGGGNFGGRSHGFDRFGLHPEWGYVGSGYAGAEPEFRCLATGIADLTSLLANPQVYEEIDWQGEKVLRPPAPGYSHEGVGHASHVLVHNGDHTGVHDADWTRIEQDVSMMQESPLKANWYGPGQRDQFIRGMKWHTVIVPRDRLTLTFADGKVTAKHACFPPPDGFRERIYEDGVLVADNASPTPYPVTKSGTVKVETWIGAGVHGSVAAAVMDEATITVALPTPEPPPPPPPAPRTLERIEITIAGGEPGFLSLVRGERMPYAVIGHYSDGTREALAATVISSQARRVRISDGAIVAVQKTPGNSTVTVSAQYGAETDALSVRVR